MQAEVTEQKRDEERRREVTKRRPHEHRVEIWVRSDGSSCQNNADDDYLEDLRKLDTIQVWFSPDSHKGMHLVHIPVYTWLSPGLHTGMAHTVGRQKLLHKRF